MKRMQVCETLTRQVRRNGHLWLFIVDHENPYGETTWIARRWDGFQWITKHCITF